MKRAIPILYSNYGRYIDQYRAIPGIDDCLKCVERRALYTLHMSAKKLTKSAKVVGQMIGMYHPHGDACVHGDTFIYNPIQNEILTFEEAFKHNLELSVLSYDFKSNSIKIGTAKHFRIGTKSKKYSSLILNDKKITCKIKLTSNHPVLNDNLQFVKIHDMNYSEYLTKVQLKRNQIISSINTKCQNLLDITSNSNVYSHELNKLTAFKANVHVEEYETAINFYDFTVDEYENMLIPVFIDGNNIEFIVIHNSAYDTVVNLVNRGFAIGQGNFGYDAVKPVSAAAYRYCITGDSLLLTQRGIQRIDSLEFTKTEPIYISNLYDSALATNWIDSGKDDIIQIKTKYGYELKGNPKHPIFTYDPINHTNKWVELKDLNIGDVAVISIPNINPRFHQFYGLCIEELILLGLIYRNRPIEIDINSDSRVINIIINYFTKYKKIIHKIIYQKDLIDILSTIYESTIQDFFPTENGTLSNNLLSSLFEIEMSQLFVGLFYDDFKYVYGVGKETTIELSLNNSDLLKQIHIILLYYYRITSKLDISNSKIIISGIENLAKFDFKLSDLFDDKYQFEYYKEVHKPLYNSNIKRQLFVNSYNEQFNDEIVEINKLDTQENVYTLTMDSKCHSYVSNGFISHNTEVKINPDVEKIGFDLIKFAPYSDPELLDELQPDYIPCPIPIGLIGEGLIHGISFNITRIPRYTLLDLFNRLTNIFQRQVDSSVEPLTIIPNFPKFKIIEDQPGDFENILTTGKGKLKLSPHYTVDKKGIHVYGRPPMGCSSWLKEDTDDKKIKYSCDDLSGKDGFEALFTPKNGSRLDQSFINMIEKVIETSISFICNVWDTDCVVLKSIDELLIRSYTKWSDCLKSKLEYEELSIKKHIREMLIIEVIRYLLSVYSSKIVTIDDLCSIYNNLPNPLPSQFTQDVLESEIRDVCKKHTISKLFNYHINKKESEDALNVILNNLTNFSQFAFTNAQSLIIK